MTGARGFSRTSSSGMKAGSLMLQGGVALDATFRPVVDKAGNESALQLNTANTNGFIKINGKAGYTSGVYLSIEGAVIGDFRADTINGFAMVAQSTYPISFYTNNTATKNASFNSDGSSSFYGTNGTVHIKTGNILEFTRNSANYFHASASGGDFRWTVNGAAVASSSMLLTTSGNLVIGHSSASARVHVRGDGTNPILRLEDTGGSAAFQFLQTGVMQFGTSGLTTIYSASSTDLNTPVLSGNALVFRTNTSSSAAGQSAYYFRPTNGASAFANTSGLSSLIDMSIGGINANTGTGSYRHLNIGYTINNVGVQSGGATATGIFLNATETNLNGMSHFLMDLQRGGVSQFSVSRTGTVTTNTINATGGIIYLNAVGDVLIIRGTGSPEGVQTANVGSIYIRTNGGTGTTIYIKESGTSNTGWVAK